ncbi:hypothetical protein TorRG33x02_070610 [Trema orientale]|uniref:Transmembrane protein n=1 Tax=Trema orientale TaxID=63057 RepID=A0A2P5FHL6_TREOI|nr:hypothetical protein TorRG33x02_070610 [Trema orientale]
MNITEYYIELQDVHLNFGLSLLHLLFTCFGILYKDPFCLLLKLILFQLISFLDGHLPLLGVLSLIRILQFVLDQISLDWVMLFEIE